MDLLHSRCWILYVFFMLILVFFYMFASNTTTFLNPGYKKENWSDIECPKSGYLAHPGNQNRLGNQLFYLSSLYIDATQRCLKPVYVDPKIHHSRKLIEIFPKLQKFILFWPPNNLSYTERLARVKNYSRCEENRDRCSPNFYHGGYFLNYTLFEQYRDVITDVFSVTYKNFEHAQTYLTKIKSNEVSRKHFKKDIDDVALGYKTPKKSKSLVTTVGIHVRRGDFLTGYNIKIGRVVINKTYLRSAMDHFREKYKNVAFIVCSDDVTWCEKVLAHEPQVYFVKGHTQEQDFVLLTQCDHMIMSTGTFGWWAAFFNGGKIVYSKDQFVRGRELWRKQWPRYKHLFPPHWIPL